MSEIRTCLGHIDTFDRMNRKGNSHAMILVALGSNVDGPWGTPRACVRKALEHLDKHPLALVKSSRLLHTAPLGVTDQPAFVNAVAHIHTDLKPEALMAHLHGLELSADRRRTLRWGPRTLDLDLIDYNGAITGPDAREFEAAGGLHGGHRPLTLPHPGIATRPFVLVPIAEIAPDWHHPVSGLTAAEMLKDLAGQTEGSELPAGGS